MNGEIKLKSLGKALQILNYFSIKHPSAGVSEISAHLGMTKSNVYDILRTLEAYNYVEQNPKTREYRLGFELVRRSFVYTNTVTSTQVIQHYLVDAVNEIGEIAYYGTIRDYKVLYLGQCLPTNSYWLPTDFSNVTGLVSPLHCTGIGKAMLAFQEDSFIEEVIARGLERFTETTITEPDALWREIMTIRRQGYSFDNMEHVYGVCCVGVPILDKPNHAIASISVHGSSVRFEQERVPAIAQRLKRCATQVQMALAHYAS